MAAPADALEFSVNQEIKGNKHSGKLKLTSQSIFYKDSVTGRSDQISFDDLDEISWRRVADGNQLKIELLSGKIKKYDGFKDEHLKKLSSYFRNNPDKEIKQEELSIKGWNWGKAEVNKDELAFTADDGKKAFEIPLGNVSNCTSNKNELSLTFHQNEDANALTMMECRFHMPMADENSDPAAEMAAMITSRADVLEAKGSAFMTLPSIQCLTPRGRYDVKLFDKFLHLHGATHDFKLTYTSIIRLFLLPHKDQRQVFFVIAIDPPIKQGQTRYPFIICVFDKEKYEEINFDLDESEVEERFEGKLQKNMQGPHYELVSRLMKAVTGRKITVPGNFKSNSSLACMACSYKAQSGVLFPLERGFMYLHKPPMHIRFDEIDNVNFARESTKLRSFEFHVQTKQGQKHIFGTIDRAEYNCFFDFVKQKGLKIRNINKHEQQRVENFSDSSGDEYPDHYANKLKDEVRGMEDDDSESDDSDFDPDKADPEAKEGGDEEFDSDAADRSTDSEDRGSSDSEEEKPKKKKEVKEKKPRKEKSSKEGVEKKTRKKKNKDGPKRAMSAYFFFINEERENIKRDNPGIKVTEVSKIAGERWREINANDKAKYEEKALKDKERYEREKAEFIAAGGEMTKAAPAKKSKKSSSSKSPTKSPAKASSSAKSAEFVASSSSDSDSD